jgi:antitoxin component YwqK of YwqJK toxin-antitoxin module
LEILACLTGAGKKHKNVTWCPEATRLPPGHGGKDAGMEDKRAVRREYYPSGAVRVERIYTYDGKQNGTTTTYYENGQVATTVTYRDDKLEGPAQAFYESGALRAEFSYADNRRHGPYRSLFESGVVEVEAEFERGLVQGAYRVNHENGALREEVRFVNSRREGLCRTYYENGILQAETLFAGGEIQTCQEYDEQGRPVKAKPPSGRVVRIKK